MWGGIEFHVERNMAAFLTKFNISLHSLVLLLFFFFSLCSRWMALHMQTLWPASWNYDTILCQLKCIYLKNTPAKFHPDTTWNNSKNKNNKMTMSKNMGSVRDPNIFTTRHISLLETRYCYYYYCSTLQESQLQPENRFVELLIIINQWNSTRGRQNDKLDLCGVRRLNGGRVVSSQAERNVKNLGMTIRLEFFLYSESAMLNEYLCRCTINVLQININHRPAFCQ